ncbi:MAG: LPXTG cell wall anchor domain-containing protein [Enterococcus casseliflavus]|nr:LPXTG cell wall anchor domain-containing protein [Enterococcus casseliflavus]
MLPKTNETKTYGVILLGLLLVLVALYAQYTKHRSKFMMVKKKRQII